MKIISVEPRLVDLFLYVIIRTDEGITGYGEAGAWGHLEASAAAIGKFAEYLVGQDPDRIEHHWNVMQRSNHYTGAAINAAISAIDLALWDIKGQALGVPIHQLLGGRTRDKARVYAWVKGRSTGQLLEQAQLRKAQGFTAIGHLNPLLDESFDSVQNLSHARKINTAVERIGRIREAVGLDVDLCIEMHRRLTPAEAITLGRELAPFHPYFYEDPIKPASIEAMAHVARQIPIPIATGERFISLQQFQTLFASRGAEYARVSVTLCGGITGARKIAALAEAHDIQLVPHNPVSPVGLAACLQLAAAIPNFALLEYPLGTPEVDTREGLQGEAFLEGVPFAEQGYVPITDRPGLGIRLMEERLAAFPPRKRDIQHINARRHLDGSVMDH